MNDSFIYDTIPDPENLNSSYGLMFQLIGHNKRILEVGCSTGFMTKILSERGCRVTAIERDARAARKAEGFAESMIVGDLEDQGVWSGLEHQTFETIVAGDVLEHLRDPLSALQNAARHLEPAGSIVLSIPNVAHGDVRLALLSGHFDYSESGLLDSTHLHFFTIHSVRALLKQAGLVPIGIYRVTVPLFQTEIQIDRESVPANLITEVLQDPEAETYQFVIRAVLDNGIQALQVMVQRIETLEQELYASRLNAILATDSAPTSSREVEELQRLLQTKTFRWSKPLRRVWSQIQSLLSAGR
jgi:2-polyprenyl-3-methyl-5-hydroxy-6-metoxy-1,4-benzoquinol methylase